MGIITDTLYMKRFLILVALLAAILSSVSAQNNNDTLTTIPQEQSMELKELVNEMQRTFATKVSVIGNDKKGRILIDYYSRDDLDRICELINLLKTKKLTLRDLSEFNRKIAK